MIVSKDSGIAFPRHLESAIIVMLSNNFSSKFNIQAGGLSGIGGKADEAVKFQSS